MRQKLHLMPFEAPIETRNTVIHIRLLHPHPGRCLSHSIPLLCNHSRVNRAVSAKGKNPSQETRRAAAPEVIYTSLPDILVAVVYISAKPISVEL